MSKLLFKVFLTAIILTNIFAIGYYIVTSYYNINPLLIYELSKPPEQNLAEILPQGSDLENPLIIPNGFRLGIFTDLNGFGMPRVLTFDPSGVLVASLTKSGKVVALPDANNDGNADSIIEIISELNSPHGLVFHSENLYVAETDKVVRYDYNRQDYTVSNPQKLFDLPSGGRHFTRTIKILDNKLYTSIGSSCDVCEESDERRSAIMVSDLDGNNFELFASGLRNTVFFVFDKRGKIWGNDMGRDFLGDNLPPDELNIIEKGKDCGWPRCYGKNVRDAKYRSFESINNCGSKQATVFDYPAHIAPLGLVFINSRLFPESEQGNILSAFHGSWNSSVPVGYKIVKLRVSDGKVTSMEDFITGWISDANALGRPVDLVFDNQGVLYISDDKSGLIYILTKSL